MEYATFVTPAEEPLPCGATISIPASSKPAQLSFLHIRRHVDARLVVLSLFALNGANMKTRIGKLIGAIALVLLLGNFPMRIIDNAPLASFRCKFCNGTGFKPGSSFECMFCKGTGKIK